jgi:hypothetical protein
MPWNCVNVSPRHAAHREPLGRQRQRGASHANLALAAVLALAALKGDSARGDFLAQGPRYREVSLNDVLGAGDRRGSLMIRKRCRAEVIRERMAAMEQLLQTLRPAARQEEWAALSSGYRLELERMQGQDCQGPQEPTVRARARSFRVYDVAPDPDRPRARRPDDRPWRSGSRGGPHRSDRQVPRAPGHSLRRCYPPP